jgi:thymidylate synthase (FAD)
MPLLKCWTQFCTESAVSKVFIVGVTEPRIEGVASAEELVAYAARVSNPTNQLNMDTAPKLMKYLIDNNHWSPLEMVSVTMEINTTRDIARQILRHRSFSFQEFSQRYASAESLSFEPRECRMQDAKNRQASVATDDRELAQLWLEKQQSLLRQVREDYQWALSNGIAKEQARAVLPEGMTGSRLYMAGTLRSWLHYCILRTEMGTQKEHREIADEALQLLIKEFPSISNITLG